MMKILAALSITMVLVSCQSMKSIETSPNCTVWMDQEYLGPYSTEVVEKNATWAGTCRTASSYNCRKVNVSYDENNNVFKDGIIIGKIEKNKFTYTEKSSVDNLIVYTSVHVYPDLKKIMASVITGDKNAETEYQYNDKCSVEQATVGAIALGLIAQVQKL